MTSQVSFTIRRPDAARAEFKVPTLPRHLQPRSESPPSRTPTPKRTHEDVEAASDDSDAGNDEEADELVTGFDQFGVQRLVDKRKPDGPLVIAPQQNRDWREFARKRAGVRATRFVPSSGRVTTGADGSVGGLGTKDTINSGPVQSGLHVRKRVKVEEDTEMTDVTETSAAQEAVKDDPETEDERALRLLLAGDDAGDGPAIDMIRPMSEDDALKQDLEELPDSASMDAYARVPVAQFGAALLRGMGWVDPATTKKGEKGKQIEPYIPESRPALLGIGAKEREVLDDGSKGKKPLIKRPERRYVPVVRKEKEGGGDSRDSDSQVSRRDDSGSRHRDDSRRRDDDRDRRREGSRERRKDDGKDRRRDSSRERRRDDRHRDDKKERRKDDYSRDDRRDDRYRSSSDHSSRRERSKKDY